MSVVINNVKNPIGRLGNQMFTLFLGKIISNHLNFQLSNLTINNILTNKDFELHYNDITKQKYDRPIQYLDHCNFNLTNIVEDKTPRKIILDHFFQQKNMYLPYKKEIQKWSKISQYNIDANDVGLHIRLDDLMHPTSLQHLLPLEYYINAIELLKPFDNLNIATDSITHPYIISLNKHYKCNIIQGTPKKTMDYLSNHNKLILSQGTFSFWIGFLSNAEKIINAVPKTGWNALSNKKEIDLLIDAPNYINIIL